MAVEGGGGILLLSEKPESTASSPTPQLSLGPHVRGTQPRRQAKKHRGEVSGFPGAPQREVSAVSELCVRLCSLCVYMWQGEPGGARFVLVAGAGDWVLRVAGLCRVCSGNYGPRRFLCFYFFPSNLLLLD